MMKLKSPMRNSLAITNSSFALLPHCRRQGAAIQAPSATNAGAVSGPQRLDLTLCVPRVLSDVCRFSFFPDRNGALALLARGVGTTAAVDSIFILFFVPGPRS